MQFRIVFMQNELYVRMERCSSVFSVLRAVAIAVISALLIVCLSFWDLISMCMTCSFRGLTTPAPSVYKVFGVPFSVMGFGMQNHGCVVCLYWGGYDVI